MLNGLYLKERLALPTCPAITKKAVESVAQKENTLLFRWLQQPPFKEAKVWLDVKLSTENIDKQSFINQTTLADGALNSGALYDFCEVSSDWETLWLALEDAHPEQYFFLKEHPQLSLLNLAIPAILSQENLIENALYQLQYQHPTLVENTVQLLKMLRVNLYDQLLPKIHKTVTSEIHYYSHAGWLPNDKPEERFKAYTTQLCTAKARVHFMQKYPVLVRQIVETTTNWQRQCLKIIQALNNDYPLICQNIFEKQPITTGALQSIRFGAGDVHRQGQTVAILCFSSGQKLVYKPRNMDMDAHFQSLIQWINAQSTLSLKTLKIISRPDYGWMEFITYSSCQQPEQLPMYYTRLGAYLAVLYLLEATDFHYENIIAHGEQPCFIDLESFFHPYFRVTGIETNQSMESSVLRTGLLPFSINLNEETPGLDLSGITDVEGQQSLVQVSTVQGLGTDNPTYTKTHAALSGAQNIPLLNGQKVRMTEEFITCMANGFSTAYQIFEQNKTQLLDKGNGILTQFTNDSIRVLFRNTMVYSHLLEEAHHPFIQRDGLEMDRHFDWLWAAVPGFELLKSILPYEKESLLHGDIPMFTSKVGSRHLWVNDETCLENFFDETGFDVVKRRVQQLNAEDMNRQCWIIKASLSTQLAASQQHVTQQTHFPAAIDMPAAATKDELIQAATAVGEYLWGQAFKSGNLADWIALRFEQEDSLKLIPMTYDLFCGLPGEILFLAYLGSVTNQDKYTQLAEKALNTLLFKLEYSKQGIRPLGLYTGWGSIIFVFTRLAALWKRPDLLNYVTDLFQTLDFEELAAVDTAHGVVKGNAGFLLAVLNHYTATANPKALQTAVMAGESLLRKAKPQPIGVGWQVVSEHPLAGYSHGTSGIIAAFNRLFAATSDNRYAAVINDALAYEDSLFDTAQGNWQDLRDVVLKAYPGQKMYTIGWAHGAPGIALTRSELLQNGTLGHGAMHQQALETAISTTQKHGMTSKLALSMGGVGNAGVVFECGIMNGRQDWITHSLEASARYLQQIHTCGWSCSLPNGLLSPGLMTGITGIGYQFLRQAAPEIVPSILHIAQ